MTTASNTNSAEQVVTRLWRQLGDITHLTFTARSGNGAQGWNGEGRGDVAVGVESSVIVFRETGHWQTLTGETLSFRNVFRWTLDPVADRVQLEHLRFGEQHPVFLFNLVAVSDDLLHAAEPHQCAADVYTGQLLMKPDGFSLDWYIRGPKKDAHIRYLYR